MDMGCRYVVYVVICVHVHISLALPVSFLPSSSLLSHIFPGFAVSFLCPHLVSSGAHPPYTLDLWTFFLDLCAFPFPLLSILRLQFFTLATTDLSPSVCRPSPHTAQIHTLVHGSSSCDGGIGGNGSMGSSLNLPWL